MRWDARRSACLRVSVPPQRAERTPGRASVHRTSPSGSSAASSFLRSAGGSVRRATSSPLGSPRGGGLPSASTVPDACVGEERRPAAGPAREQEERRRGALDADDLADAIDDSGQGAPGRLSGLARASPHRAESVEWMSPRTARQRRGRVTARASADTTSTTGRALLGHVSVEGAEHSRRTRVAHGAPHVPHRIEPSARGSVDGASRQVEQPRDLSRRVTEEVPEHDHRALVGRQAGEGAQHSRRRPAEGPGAETPLGEKAFPIPGAPAVAAAT